jgi:broad specificity phosphatase PhoE
LEDPMTRIYLIRHGRPATAWGGGDDDPGLDDAGKAQAIAVAQGLLDLPDAERPRAVASSPLRRCRETAQPFADAIGVKVEIVPSVGEIPTPAGLSAVERPAWLRESFSGRWVDIVGDLDYDLWRREVASAVESRPGVAIFSHFVAINAVLSVIEKRDEVIVFRPDHVSVTTLELSVAGLSLVARGREATTGVL